MSVAVDPTPFGRTVSNVGHCPPLPPIKIEGDSQPHNDNNATNESNTKNELQTHRAPIVDAPIIDS